MQAIKEICQRLLSLFVKKPMVPIISSVIPMIVDQSKVYENSCSCDESCDESCSCSSCDNSACICVPAITDILPFQQVEMPKVPEFPAPQPLDDTATDTDTQHSDDDESEDTQDESLDDHEE